MKKVINLMLYLLLIAGAIVCIVVPLSMRRTVSEKASSLNNRRQNASHISDEVESYFRERRKSSVGIRVTPEGDQTNKYEIRILVTGLDSESDLVTLKRIVTDYSRSKNIHGVSITAYVKEANGFGVIEHKLEVSGISP